MILLWAVLLIKSLVFFLSPALNLIGPRAVDVLSELSYAPMTPEHFPSLFCKVGIFSVHLQKCANGGEGPSQFAWLF